MKCRRRDFMRITATAAAACPFAVPSQLLADSSASFPARYWRARKEGWVVCHLCPHSCRVPEGGRGQCNVRVNRGGEYFTLVHSNPCSLNNDPIEKKPLFHFHPGSNAFSIATVGCNIECRFCQNWEISQFTPDQVPSRHMTPDDVVRAAIEQGATTIAFTYSEPVVWYEYMLDICIAAQGTKLKKVIISNGYIQEKPHKDLLGHLDGVKIDFKAFSETFYRDVCSAHLRPVLDSLRRVKASGVWLEMVMLTVPSLNDNERELDAMAKWIVQNLGPDVPIHFTRFHPMYKLKNLPPTPVKTLEKARKIALRNGIRFAYAGNVPGHPGEDTYCPSCQKTLIRRDGYHIVYNRVRGGQCPYCSAPIPGVWE